MHIGKNKKTDNRLIIRFLTKCKDRMQRFTSALHYRENLCLALGCRLIKKG